MIKWFDSKLMTGIPEIANNQGDLVKMLNGLLVNGVNLKAVISVSYASGVCTLNVGANHGFVRHSIVRVIGSTQSALTDSEFRVKSLSVTTISFDIPAPVSSESGLTVGYAPLGWTQHFASEGRSCYKSTNPLYPAYLRVDDTKFADTASNAAKFAGVEICENMTDFNTATWQSPFNENSPNLNREAVTGQSNGWFKWYYASDYSTSPDITISPSGNRRYVLIGDESQFWLLLYPYVDENSKYSAAVGMPILDFGLQKYQALSATYGFNYSNYYPHNSLLNAPQSSVAPYLSGLGSGISPKFTSDYAIADLLPLIPVFFKDAINPTLISASFLGASYVPAIIEDTAVVRSGDKDFIIRRYGADNKSLIFDLGGA